MDKESLENSGGKNGDLFIKIKIEDDKKFKLEGYDLYTDIYLTPWEAALGTKVELESIDENISIHIPQGTQSGEKINITGKGYKVGDGLRGNLIARAQIMVPKNLSDIEKEYFEKLNKISNFNPRV